MTYLGLRHVLSLTKSAYDRLCGLTITLKDQKGGGTMGMVSRMGFVGMIDPTYSESYSYCTNLYRGFMRVQINRLYDLAARQLTYFSMDEICPSSFWFREGSCLQWPRRI